MSNLKEKISSSDGSLRETAKRIGAKEVFYSNCDILLVKAYYQLLNEKKYKKTWEEDTFTTNMHRALDDICQDQDIPYMPMYQEHQLTSDILSGSVRPIKARKIDIVFATFFKPRIKYGVEVKILAETNFGSRNANQLAKEYVVSGVDRFVRKEYDTDGCMIGYVVNGNITSVYNMINQVFENLKRKPEKLNDQHTIENYSCCYLSEHKDFFLKHILFHFS